MAKQQADFTKGKIIVPLLKFAIPIFCALFLQAMYGAIDLMVVGRFATSVDVSAVSTGAQIMQTLATVISSLAMGTTIFLGHKLGEGKRKDGGAIVGSSITMFLSIGVVLTVLIPIGAGALASAMHAPQEAFLLTRDYIRICGVGSIAIIAYNLIGSIFRGLGDSRTPLITVIVACICNIVGDMLLVAVFHMGTKGAAIATVCAQLISVVISLLLIRRQSLPFTMAGEDLRPNKTIIRRVISLGAPIAVQDMLVCFSFLLIMAIVNGLGLTASAGVGVALKVTNFIMLMPGSFMQAMSAFVAQNRGAGEYRRAGKALVYAIIISECLGVVLFYLAFFHGNLLNGLFSNDPAVIAAASDYLRAYAIDCLLTCFLFCFLGYFNGMGNTKFVMVQGIVAAFAIRIPVAYFMSLRENVSLFQIGLGIPLSTVFQIILCFICLRAMNRKLRKDSVFAKAE